MRLIYSFPLFLVLTLGCQTSVNRQPGNTHDEALRVLKVYHTNDIHAHLNPDPRGRGGLAYLASVLKLIRQQDPDSLILDGGDFYKKGSLPAQKSNDEVTADMMTQLPYWDARVVGNNEVKVGISRLLEWAKTKEHAPLLSANFVDRNKNTVFKPTMILKRAGLTIGLIGLTEPVTIESNVQADPKKDPRAPYTILNPNEVIDPLIKELRPQVDILIVLSHQVFTNNVKFQKSHPEVDLVVSGHSHVISGDQKKYGTGMVVEAGQFGDQIGVVNLVYNMAIKKVMQIESTFWPVGENLQIPDQALAARIRDAYVKWAPNAYEQIGLAEDDFKIINAEHPYEASLDDWASDVFCKVTGCDVAIVNRELLREPFYKGAISKESVFFTVPYSDHIALVTLGRSKLEKMLIGAIQNVYEKTGLMEYGFHGISAHLFIHDHNLKKVKLKFATDKTELKVALPLYLTTHCLEFFTKDACPLPVIEKDIDTKSAFEAAVLQQKNLRPSPADRIEVREFQKPQAISAEDDNDSSFDD